MTIFHRPPMSVTADSAGHDRLVAIGLQLPSVSTWCLPHWMVPSCFHGDPSYTELGVASQGQRIDLGVIRKEIHHSHKADVYDAADVARLVAGHDALISAFNPGWSNPDLYTLQIKGTNAIIEGSKRAGLTRLLFVGGSGSLEASAGVQGVDLPGFPEAYKQGALATREALNMLRQEMHLDWTVLSPSADLFTGERTGRFRLGTDQLLRDAKGESRISVEDFALAMMDEVEHPQHIRRRFTVGY